jgi:hypothetical protein
MKAPHTVLTSMAVSFVLSAGLSSQAPLVTPFGASSTRRDPTPRSRGPRSHPSDVIQPSSSNIVPRSQTFTSAGPDRAGDRPYSEYLYSLLPHGVRLGDSDPHHQTSLSDELPPNNDRLRHITIPELVISKQRTFNADNSELWIQAFGSHPDILEIEALQPSSAEYAARYEALYDDVDVDRATGYRLSQALHRHLQASGRYSVAYQQDVMRRLRINRKRSLAKKGRRRAKMEKLAEVQQELDTRQHGNRETNTEKLSEGHAFARHMQQENGTSHGQTRKATEIDTRVRVDPCYRERNRGAEAWRQEIGAEGAKRETSHAVGASFYQATTSEPSSRRYNVTPIEKTGGRRSMRSHDKARAGPEVPLLSSGHESAQAFFAHETGLDSYDGLYEIFKGSTLRSHNG